MTDRLAQRLRTETKALHTRAEHSDFMRALLTGRLPPPAYAALLRNLHAIYATLEPALAQHQTHPLIVPVYLPGLWRAATLVQDLVVLRGPRWAEELALLPATMAYVARLRDLESTQPELLLAHAYVRYLGDLSGGQMLRRIVAKSLGPAQAGAIAFYDFGDAAQTHRLAQAFRAGLAAVAVDAAQIDRLVSEACLAFELHQQLFDELAAANTIAPDESARAPQASNNRMRP